MRLSAGESQPPSELSPALIGLLCIKLKHYRPEQSESAGQALIDTDTHGVTAPLKENRNHC